MDYPLVHIDWTGVAVFSFTSSSWTRSLLSTPLPLDWGSRWIWLETQLFCSGGMEDSESRKAYLIGRNWKVKQIANMLQARCYHGLWWDKTKTAVLVFGGYLRSDNVTVESMETEVWQDTVWQALPAMSSGRAGFNPCYFHFCLYLCGSGSIEAFDLLTRTFLSLQMRLPDLSTCVTFIENSELVVVSETHMSRWRVVDTELVCISERTYEDFYLTCNMPPVVDAVNGVVYVLEEGHCSAIQLSVMAKCQVDSR